MAADWLDEALKARPSDALDILFEQVDTMLWAGDDEQKWPEIEVLLADSRLDAAPLGFLVGVLSATLPIRAQSQGRARIADIVRQREPKRAGGLLQGLMP